MHKNFNCWCYDYTILVFFLRLQLLIIVVLCFLSILARRVTNFDSAGAVGACALLLPYPPNPG